MNFNAYAWLAVHDAAGIAAGAYLVAHDSPWWAALCFFMVMTAKVTTSTKVELENDPTTKA